MAYSVVVDGEFLNILVNHKCGACTVTNLNVQYSALLIIGCYQNSPLTSEYKQHVNLLLINGCLV